MWAKFVDALNNMAPGFIKGFLVSIVLGAVGLSSGIWKWVIGDALQWLWAKEIKPELDKEAASADEKQKEDAALNKLADAEKTGDQNAIKDAAGNVLNG